MLQSPSWEANWFAASQEILRISRNPKVHYRTHKRPSPVSILGQPNPVHIPTSHLLEIHPNIIHPSTPRSPQWSLRSFKVKNFKSSFVIGYWWLNVCHFVQWAVWTFLPVFRNVSNSFKTRARVIPLKYTERKKYTRCDTQSVKRSNTSDS